MTVETVATTTNTTAPPPIWRSAAATLGTRVIDIPSRYGFHLLVAWKLGIVDAGAFYILFSFLTLAAGLGRFGIDRALTREVARTMALGAPALCRATILHGLRLIALFSVAAMLILAALAPLLATHLFARPDMLMPCIYAAITAVPLCLSAGVGGALAGLHRVSLSQMIYSWLWPALFCLLALMVPLDLERALLLVLVATSIAALLSALLLWRYMPRAGTEAGAGSSPRLLGLGWSLFSTDIVQLMISALPALALGMFAGEAAVGAYALAWRLALILNLLVVAIGAMASPRFADQSARGDMAGLQRTARHALALVLLLGALPALVLAVGAPWLLPLFGKGFDSGVDTLRLLLVGQLILMATATTPELLGMTGHERAIHRVNSLSILLYLPLLCLLSWTMGANGAAIATVIVSLFNAAGATWLAHKWLHFSPLTALVGGLRGRSGERRHTG